VSQCDTMSRMSTKHVLVLVAVFAAGAVAGYYYCNSKSATS
jgi:hypothetical protein